MSKELKGYNVSIQMSRKMSNTMLVPGVDEEDAKQRALKLFDKRDDAEVVDIYNVDDCPQIKELMVRLNNNQEGDLGEMKAEYDEAAEAVAKASAELEEAQNENKVN